MKNLKPILLTGIFCLALITSTFSQVIRTIIGGNTMNGEPARKVKISIFGLAIDPGGRFYLSDLRGFVWQLVNDTLWHAAGMGLYGNSGDGMNALSARINANDICINKKGEILLGCEDNVIRKVNTDGIITTIAGTGEKGFSGDGGPAINAKFGPIPSICVDDAGNIFVDDVENYRIRKIDTSGIVTTVAGNGVQGILGNGGPAVNANLYSPLGIAVDNVGNLFITEFGKRQIRKVDTAGIISLFAGNSQSTSTLGDGDGGLAINARLTSVAAKVFPDGKGNIYIPESGQLRRVDQQGIISTVAGSSQPDASLSDGISATKAKISGYIRAITVDSIGNLYFSSGSLVRKIGLDGNINTIAGNTDIDFPPAPPLSLQLPSISNLQINSRQELVFAANNRVRVVYKNDSISTFSTVPVSTLFCDNFSGGIFFYDQEGYIRSLGINGASTIVGGTGSDDLNYNQPGGLPATQVNIGYLRSMVGDAAGNLYFTESFINSIRKIDTNGIITTFAGNKGYGNSGDGGPALDASFPQPLAMALDHKGNFLFSTGNNIRKISTGGIISAVAGNGTSTFNGDGILATAAGFYTSSITIDRDNSIVFADGDNGKIRRIDTAGIITTIAGGGEDDGEGVAANAARIFPSYVAIDSSGNIIFSESANHRIRQIDFATNYWTGAENMAWENPNNWSMYAVPNELTHVVINSGTVIVSSDAIARSLKLLPGVNFTVASGGNLTVLY